MTSEGLVLLAVGLSAALAAGALAWLAVQWAPRVLEIYRARFHRLATAQGRDLFLSLDPAAVFGVNLGVMLAGFALAFWLTGSLLVAGLCLVLLAAMPRLVYAFLRRRRMRRFDEQLPNALMMVAGGMRAGLSLTGAMHHLVEEAGLPLRQEFGLVLREHRLGLPLESALQNLTRRMPTRTTVLVVSAMRVATETGGGLAETLERISQTIRRQLQMEDKIRALTAQGRLQAWVVGSMPLLLLALLNTLQPKAMAVMWHTPLGWAALATIAVLEVLGVMLILRITRIDV